MRFSSADSLRLPVRLPNNLTSFLTLTRARFCPNVTAFAVGRMKSIVGSSIPTLVSSKIDATGASRPSHPSVGNDRYLTHATRSFSLWIGQLEDSEKIVR